MNVIQKSSKNYSETHHSIRGPEVSREFHEVRSYSSGGDHNSNMKDNFNLEREVQHMIPLNSSVDKSFGSLQSANMVSSVQQQKTFTTYKVQTNQYTSSGARMVPVDFHENEHPSSKLKQNIDELDTLLSDLNNAKGTSSTVVASNQGHVPHQQNHDYNSVQRGGGGTTSSDDYSLSDSGFQGGLTKKAVSSFNEYNYQSHSSTSDMYRKPPSPLLNKKRYPGGSPGPAHLASPNTVRRASPGLAAPAPDLGATSTSYNYNYSSSSHINNGHHVGHEARSSRPEYNDKSNYRMGSPNTPDTHRSSPSPSGPRVPSSPRDGTPTGTSYYSKYHSTQSHQSQRSTNGPMAFPTNTPPRHHGSQTIQSPPKRVDELMSELADFDPSIQPSDIAEPMPSRGRRPTDTQIRDNHLFDEQESGRKYNNYQRSPSPARHAKQPSTPGPPVYYPPGPDLAVAEHGYVEGGRGKASMRQEYGYKDKSRHQESDSKGGAAVVPICLPLCCAAPCVIM